MKWLKRFLLEIWSKIKCLFGRRKMGIEETVNKWLKLINGELANIKEQIDSENGIPDEQEHIYNYCLLVKTLAGNYSTVILELCNQGKELPAKIILRTLAELVIKFSWCMSESHKDISTFYVRCEQWTKSSLLESQRFLKRALECFGDEQIKQNLLECQGNVKKLETKNAHNMPNDAQICKDLFGGEGSLNYLILFGSIHEVVHSDLAFLTKLRIGNRGFLISDDSNEIVKQMCMACIYLLFKYIYQYYKFDFSIIESDYARLKK